MKTKTKAKNIVWRVVGGVLLPFIMTASGLALTACPQETKPGPTPTKPYTPPEVKFGSTVINVDYGSATQAQKEDISSKLNSAMSMFLADEFAKGKINNMIEKPGFKIIIVPGSGGVVKSGINMTLGVDFFDGKIAQDIALEINNKVVINDIFGLAMLITPSYIVKAARGVSHRICVAYRVA